MSRIKCPICHKNFIEINKSHLRKHNLDVKGYDVLYPNHPRMTDERRRSHARYQCLSPEVSNKLKKSHTLEGYIDRYGLEEGTRRFNQRSINCSKSKTVDNFITKYGLEEGTRRFEEFQNINKNKMSLNNFITKYGLEEGTRRFEEFVYNNKKSSTLEGYIDRYGLEEGTRRFEERGHKHSLKMRKIPLGSLSDYEYYKYIVDKFTRQSLKQNKLENFDKRGRGKGTYHVDHKISKLKGFENNIPPFIIGSIYNLEMILAENNASKQSNCSIGLDELIQAFYDVNTQIS